MQLTFDTGAAVNGKFPFNGQPGDLTSVLQRGTTIETVLAVQRTQNIRAQNASFVGRGNAAKRVSFTVANEWPTLSAAEDEFMSYEDNLVGQSGTLIMTSVNDKGTKVRYLNNAEIVSVKSSNMGVTNFHSIVIEGGAITTSA